MKPPPPPPSGAPPALPTEVAPVDYFERQMLLERQAKIELSIGASQLQYQRDQADLAETKEQLQAVDLRIRAAYRMGPTDLILRRGLIQRRGPPPPLAPAPPVAVAPPAVLPVNGVSEEESAPAQEESVSS